MVATPENQRRSERAGQTGKKHVRLLEQDTFYTIGTQCVGDIPWAIDNLQVTTVPTLLESVQPIIGDCQECTTRLAALLPKDQVSLHPSSLESDFLRTLQFWRYKDMWTFSLRNAVFAIFLVGYLQSRTLVSLSRMSEILGRKRLPADEQSRLTLWC
jgi:hypothetical protein